MTQDATLIGDADGKNVKGSDQSHDNIGLDDDDLKKKQGGIFGFKIHPLPKNMDTSEPIKNGNEATNIDTGRFKK